MAALEPNVIALAWFALFSTLCCVGFLILSGSFPLSAAKERGQASSPALALINGALMLVLVGFTLAFGLIELRVTSVIVVAGLAFLFAPASFEIWPERWKDGRAVLAIMALAQLGAIAALYRVGGEVLAPLV
jgi:TRAP-type C4-dicarboxylate transport system permease small subunit